MLLNIADIQKYVAACASKVGVSVSFVNKATPSTNGKHITLPTISSTMSEDDKVKLVQFVKHETAHIAYSDFGVLERHKPKGLLMFIDNMLEDHRIDYINDSMYDGDRLNTEQFMDIYCRETHTMDSPAPALFAWDAWVRGDLWDNTGEDHFAAMCSDEDLAIRDKLVAGNYADVLRNIRTIEDKAEGSEAIYQLAKRILKEVFGEDADKYEQPESSDGKGKGEGEGTEKGVGAAGGDTKHGEGESAGEGKELRYVDFDGAKMLPMKGHATGEGINAANFTCGTGGTGYKPDTPAETHVHDFTTGISSGWTMGARCGGHYDINRLLANEASLANTLRTKLQIVSRDRWEFGKKSGKMRSAALWKVAGGVNDRVFKKQIHNDTLDVAVQIVVDASGSMSGSKFEHAAAAACLLNHTLSNVLHIPVEIVAFTELWGLGETPRNTMFVLKNFAKPVSTQQMVGWWDIVGSNYLADNVDGESLAWSFHRLRQRKEKRRIMVVLSDGCPCGGHRKGEIDSYTRRIIEEVEASPIEIVGVGLMYDMVKSYYKKWAVIDHASNIESALISIVDKHVFA